MGVNEHNNVAACNMRLLNRSLNKESCMEIVNLALSIPDVLVLGIGPESCLRVLYFRALRELKNDRLFLRTMDQSDLVTSKHLEDLATNIREIILNRKSDVRALIIYISCCDIILESDFDSVFYSVQKELGIPIKLFKRGPLSKRRILPKERLGIIFSEIHSYYSVNELKNDQNDLFVINILGESTLQDEHPITKLLRENKEYSIIESANLSSFSMFKDMEMARISIATDKFGQRMAEYFEKCFEIPYVIETELNSFEKVENIIKEWRQNS
jgi:hypothetical protein